VLIGIDHLVVVVPDLDHATRNYEALGFAVVPGGRHPIGTHNALIAFADGAYLELIAFREPNPTHRWWKRLQQGGGLSDFCMRTDDIEADRAAFGRAGVVLDEPWPLTRVRPDGYTVRWKLAIPRDTYFGVSPFLIVDETPLEERVPRMRRHGNGATGIASLTVAVEAARLPEVRGWYRTVLGSDGEAVKRDDLQAGGVRFMAGPHALEFVAPAGAGGPLPGWLRQRGSGPYAASLSGPTARETLDPALALGARLSIA
jgi:hypothetical protein